MAGFLLQKELDYLAGAVDSPKRPFAAIVGGSKVSSKIGVLEKLIEKCDKIIIGYGVCGGWCLCCPCRVGSCWWRHCDDGWMNLVGCLPMCSAVDVCTWYMYCVQIFTCLYMFMLLYIFTVYAPVYAPA